MNRLMQSRKRRGSLRVLVAHGSPLVRRRCEELIARQRGVRVVATTHSASSTLQTAGLRRLDLILLGTGLRGANGVELLLALKRRWPEAFVVMVAGGSGTPAEMMKYLAAGANLFINRADFEGQLPIILHHFGRRTTQTSIAGASRLERTHNARGLA